MNCWTLLGIDYTSDLITIKRAYAIKLKITRPEDDAKAYQELRDAYQQASKAAKLRPFNMSETDSAHSPITGDLVPNENDNSTPTEYNVNNFFSDRGKELDPAKITTAEAVTVTSELRSEHAFDSEQLVAQVLHQWRLLGDTDLLSYWPELERQLMLTPLSEANQYSAEFADMILDNRRFPAEFTERLMEYFEWRSDFRLERILGKEASRALQEHLVLLPFQIRVNLVNIEVTKKRKEAAEKAEADAIAALEPRRQALRERHRHAISLAQSSLSKDPMQAELFALMAGPPLRREWASLTAEHFATLGISVGAQERVGYAFRQARISARLVTAFFILIGTGVRLALGKWHEIELPLVVLAFAFCYYLPVGQLNEKLRSWVYPQRLLTLLIRPDVLNPQVLNIVFCSIAATICMVWSRNNPGVEIVYFQAFLWPVTLYLALAWLTRPNKETSALDISPSIFLICALTVWAQKAHNLPLILSLAAAWHALSYAFLQIRGERPLALIFILGGVLLFANPGTASTVLLGFGIPWLLFKLSMAESAGFVTTAICIAWITLPAKHASYLMLWTGVVSLLALLFTVGLRKYSQRAQS